MKLSPTPNPVRSWMSYDSGESSFLGVRNEASGVRDESIRLNRTSHFFLPDDEDIEARGS